MDALADLLGRTAAHGSLFAHTRLHGDWGVRSPPGGRLSVHAVLSGDAWCRRTGQEPVHVPDGHVLLLRGSEPVELLSGLHVPVVPLEQMLAGEGPDATVPHGEGPGTELICGEYTFRGTLCTELLDALPDSAVVSAADPTVAATLALVSAELGAERAGGRTVLDRLLDVLLVALLRVIWADQLHPPVWAGVPQDPDVAAALRALHAEPARRWTVDALAREARLSRATLARRFAAQVGRPPLAYLTQWRMQLARDALAQGDTLAQVARQVGYSSEFAFAAAFTREVGTAPGRWRDAQAAPAG